MSVIYVLFTGGFDPIHSGHINAIRQSAQLGNVIVAPNSDEWLQKKKGAAFQPLYEREEIIRSIVNVSGVLTGWDDSDGTACGAIKMFYERYACSGRNTLLFANGGDRTPYTVSKEEIELCSTLGILPIFNVGGSKTQSSSAFLQEWSRHL
jgi:D-beta-D-heptose 7-phosphate kinase/D-beta-D-heptose 1-phosphate adenosyltransferase